METDCNVKETGYFFSSFPLVEQNYCRLYDNVLFSFQKLSLYLLSRVLKDNFFLTPGHKNACDIVSLTIC